MLYALICTDKPHMTELRANTRADHLAYLDALGGKLKAAGPFLDDDGTPSGSLIIIEASNRQEALVVSEEDPYERAGLFEHVEIRPWSWALKNPEC